MAKPNLISRLSDSKTRSFVILFGAIVVVGVVIAFMKGGKAKDDELSKQGSVAAGIPDDIRATPGNVSTEKYRELQLQQNVKRAQDALEKKESAIPTIINTGTDPTNKAAQDAAAIDAALKNQQKANLGKLGLGDAEGSGFGSGGFGQGGQGGPGSAGGAGGAGAGGFGADGTSGFGQDGFGRSQRDRDRELQEKRLREQREALERQKAEQERLRQLEAQRRLAEQQKKEYETAVQKTAGQMKNYASAAYSEWAKFPTQAYVSGPLADKPFKRATPDVIGGAGAITTPGASAEARSLGNVRPNQKKVFVKAGTIVYGVMDTAVNSDENGPILVTIVSGKYRGGKMIGSFTHQPQQESVIMSFDKMTVPKRAKTVAVEVVAVDPDTARTALATDVDKHYILRYGTLFAASFMQGYGQAITQAGTTTVSPLTGTTTTTTPELSGREQFLAALGEVGKQWANAVRPYFNTPYTVTVDQGTSVGLLFLSDVDVTDDAP